jgi:hypothetical protein
MKDMRMAWNEIFRTGAPGCSILVRLLVGLVVFLPEGIQKLVFPDTIPNLERKHNPSNRSPVTPHSQLCPSRRTAQPLAL